MSSTKAMDTTYFVSHLDIILAIACFIYLFLSYKKYRENFCVPTNWPIVGMLPGLLVNLQHLHYWGTMALKEGGCTIQFRAPWFVDMDMIATCDPANVNHVFNTNHSNYPKGEAYLEIFDILGDGIFNADDEPWKMQRKKALGVISSPSFRAFVVLYSHNKVEEGLVPLLSRLADRGVAVDLQDLFLRLTFDMTCNLVFGVDPGSLTDEFPIVPFARAMDDAMVALFYRHAVPPTWWKLMRRLGIGWEKRLTAAAGVIDDFVAQNIAKKREGKGKPNGEDILTCYIEEGEESCNDKHIRDTTVNLMLAGRDTTGVALTWFFWLVAKNPDVKTKILEELAEHDSREKTYPIMFSHEVISKLVYLHAALCESLRLYPSVPFEHKEPLKSDVLPNGMKINAGAKLVFSTYSMARLEGVWGKDCYEFKPERWISEKGTIRHEPSYKFFSFNCGPRSCLGKDIAFTQMKTVAATMIYNFDLELVEGHAVEPKPSIILHMKNGLMVRIKRRAVTNEHARQQ